MLGFLSLTMGHKKIKVSPITDILRAWNAHNGQKCQQVKITGHIEDKAFAIITLAGLMAGGLAILNPGPGSGFDSFPVC